MEILKSMQPDRKPENS